MAYRVNQKHRKSMDPGIKRDGEDKKAGGSCKTSSGGKV